MSPSLRLLERIPGERGPIVKRMVKEQISDKLAYMIHSGLVQPGDETTGAVMGSAARAA